jgi:hypothetical protein
MSDADPDPAAAAREQLLATHAETLQALLDAADAVATGDPTGSGDATGGAAEGPAGEAADAGAAGWHRLEDGRLATADRETIGPVFSAVLDDRGILSELPELLTAAVEAAGYDLPARPVSAPPYVAITSTGAVLRATVADGRIVVRVDCFEVVRGVDGAGKNGVVYARTATEPAAALAVALIPSN